MAQEQLETARDLIRQRQYEQARALLKTVDHPTAAKWLAKLDEIAPESPLPPAPKTTVRAAMTPRPQVDRGDSLPEYKPWNPNFLGTMTFFLTSFVSGTALSLNWRRLGKPDYLAPTLLLTFAMPGLALLVIYTLVTTATRTGAEALGTFPAVVILMLSATANIFFIFGVATLQNGGYKAWKKHGSAALQQYKYPVYQISAIFAGLAVLFALVASVFLWSDIKARVTPKTLVSGSVSVNYPPAWESVDVQQVPGCDATEVHCVFALSLSPFHFTSAVLVEFTVSEGLTASDIEQAIWASLLECSTCAVELIQTAEATVGGHPAVSRQYWLTDFEQNGERSYLAQTYVVVGAFAYEFTVTTPNPGIYQEDQRAIDGVLNGIQFIGASNQA
jgi:hypothetical protein